MSEGEEEDNVANKPGFLSRVFGGDPRVKQLYEQLEETRASLAERDQELEVAREAHGTELQEARTEIARLRDLAAKIQAEFEAAEAARSKLSAIRTRQVNQIERAEVDLKDRDAKLAAADAERTKLRKDRDGLRAQLARAREELEKARTQAETQVGALQETKDALARANEELAKAQENAGELTSLQAALDAAQEQGRALAADIAGVRKELAEAQSREWELSIERDTLEANAATFREGVAAIQAQLGASRRLASCLGGTTAVFFERFFGRAGPVAWRRWLSECVDPRLCDDGEFAQLLEAAVAAKLSKDGGVVELSIPAAEGMGEVRWVGELLAEVLGRTTDKAFRVEDTQTNEQGDRLLRLVEG